MNENLKEYALNGGGKVTVIKPFSANSYSAVVKMNGRYPEEGKVARNYKRTEFVYIIDGEFKFTINGSERNLKAGETVRLSDGATYFILGAGTSLVMVKDDEGGETVIEDFVY